MTDPAAESVAKISDRDVLHETAPAARPRWRLAPWLIAVVLMVGLLGWQYLKPAAPPAGKPADAPRPVPVSVAAAVAGDLGVTLAGSAR